MSGGDLVRILFVDDDEQVRWTIQTVLESIGHHVTSFDSALIAYNAFLATPEKFDCLLLDRNMPEMDGLSLLRKIRADSRFNHTPVVMLTSSSEPDSVAEGLAAGAQLYLTKPAPRKLLRAAMLQIEAGLDEKKEIIRHLSESKRGFQHLKQMHFELRTPTQGREVAALLASLTPDPDKTVLGFNELLTNAIEHGNLAIDYKLKSELLENENLASEIEKRLEQAPFCERKVRVDVTRSCSEWIIDIIDEGAGFDWRPFLDFDPLRAFDLHGRGIAISKKMAFDSLHYMGNGNQVRVTVKLAENQPTTNTNDTTQCTQSSTQNSPLAKHA